MTITEPSETEDSERNDDIALIYRAQADLAILAELMARDHTVMVPDRPMTYLAVFDYEVNEQMSGMKRH